MKNKIHQQTIKAINSKILSTTILIQERYPELIKFLNEMPVTIPDEQNPEITIKTLKEYHDSLETLLNDYIIQHRQL